MLLSIAWGMETIGRNIMQIFQDFDYLSVNLQIALDDLNNDDIFFTNKQKEENADFIGIFLWLILDFHQRFSDPQENLQLEI